jgi:hypothetical protein
LYASAPRVLNRGEGWEGLRLKERPLSLIIVTVIPSFFGGGFAGAVLTWLVNQKARRTQVALDHIDQCISKQNEIAEVKGILQALGQNHPFSPNEQNRVRRLGDWFEVVALLCRKHYADQKLITQTVLFKEMKDFRNRIDGARTRVNELSDAPQWWQNLYKLK